MCVCVCVCVYFSKDMKEFQFMNRKRENPNYIKASGDNTEWGSQMNLGLAMGKELNLLH